MSAALFSVYQHAPEYRALADALQDKHVLVYAQHRTRSALGACCTHPFHLIQEHADRPRECSITSFWPVMFDPETPADSPRLRARELPRVQLLCMDLFPLRDGVPLAYDVATVYLLATALEAGILVVCAPAEAKAAACIVKQHGLAGFTPELCAAFAAEANTLIAGSFLSLADAVRPSSAALEKLKTEA